MRSATILMILAAFIALPASAIDFMGVELCKGSTDTRVSVAPGSSLVLESVEIGDHGGLILLFSARSGKVMDHVDDLMTGITGQRGQGDGDSLEWSDGRLTGVAQRVAKKYAALAVTSSDDCPGAQEAPAAAPAETTAAAATAAAPATEAAPVTPRPDEPAPDLLPDPVVPVAATTAAAAATQAPSDPEPAPAATPEFEVIGAISHVQVDPIWVDVMGVVANHTDKGYSLATFDLSFYDAAGALICVDTISVSVLKSGQERAFRDSVRCRDYDTDKVRKVVLQFAGGF